MTSAAAQSAIRNPQSAIPTGWMPVAEAARVLGCTERAIRLRCASGRLDAVRGGAERWYINPNCDPALRMAAGLFCPHDPPVPALAGSPLAGLSAAKREGIARRYRSASAYLAAREHKPADMTLPAWERRFLEAWNVMHPEDRTSRSTLLRHVKALREDGISALVDGRDYHGPASISPGALDFILGLYCRENRHHLAAIYERAAALAPVEGWRLPCLRTVQRIVAERVDPRIVALGRRPKAYRDRCLPTAIRDWSKVAAMQLWVADHRLLDIWVPRRWYDAPKDRDRVTWQRPWLTLFLDGRSWLPTAWQIAWDSPNAQRVAQTFIRGISQHGCPEAVYLDNGKDFRAKMFAGGRPLAASHRKKRTEIFRPQRVGPLLEMLGITAHWALPYNARAKVVEPFFGLVAERFDKCWDTYCGNSPENTPEQIKGLKAEDYEQALTLTGIHDAFDEWVTGDYALRESPAGACRGLSAAEAFSTLRSADFVRRVPPVEDLMLLCLPSRPGKVGPNGIFVTPFLRHYDCGELDPYRCSNRRVTYRYNEHDASVVYVFDAASDKFVGAAGIYAGEQIDPLAGAGSDDAERLAGVMERRGAQARDDKAELKRLTAFAANVLLASQRDAAAKLGLHLGGTAFQAVPGSPQAGRPVPPTVIPLIAGGELSLAAAAGRQRHKRNEQTRRARTDVAALLPTGTDAADARPGRVSIRDILPAAEDYGDHANEH